MAEPAPRGGLSLRHLLPRSTTVMRPTATRSSATCWRGWRSVHGRIPQVRS